MCRECGDQARCMPGAVCGETPQCIRLHMSANPLASLRYSSLVSRFVQLLDSVLCYLIPRPEDSSGTFNALRVSARLPWDSAGTSISSRARLVSLGAVACPPWYDGDRPAQGSC